MWRRFWHRDAPDPPLSRGIYTRYGQLIKQMVAADEKAERERLGHMAAVELEIAIGAGANNAMVAIWDVESQWRGLLQEQLGATNEMIGEVLTGQREQGAAVAALRAEFHQVGERVTDMEFRLTAVEDKVSAHDESRDVSIAERQQLFGELADSKADRAAINQRLTVAERQRDDMAAELSRTTETLERIERAMHGHLSREESEDLIRRFEVVERVVLHGREGIPEGES